MSQSVTFEDNFTVTVGDRVSYDTRYGGHGTGTVLGFRRDCGSTNVLIEPDPLTAVYGWLDRWPLTTGGEFNGPRTHGVSGGCILRPQGTSTIPVNKTLAPPLVGR